MVPPKWLQEVFRLAKAHWNNSALPEQSQPAAASGGWQKFWKTGAWRSPQLLQVCKREGHKPAQLTQKPMWHIWRQVKQVSVTVLVPLLTDGPWAGYQIFPGLCFHIFLTARRGVCVAGGRHRAHAQHLSLWLDGWTTGHPGPPPASLTLQQPPLLWSVNNTPVSSIRKTTPCSSEYSGLFGRGLCLIN